MKFEKSRNLRLNSVALAVMLALTSLSAHADDEEIAALTKPTNYVDVMGIYVTSSSAKFGEYNGLNKQGAYINGNLGLRGGDAYTNNENGGTMRYELIGTNLGLSNRSATLSVANQGSWRLGIGYDALTQNISDSYQTPYSGAIGGNSFRLPTSFGLVPNTMTMTPGQLASFNNPGIYTTRQNSSFDGSKIINSNWDMSFGFNHLDQSGAKLMSFGSAGIYGASGEKVSILPMPTNYQTDTFNLALNWKGEKGRLSASYFGSFFQDAYDSVSFTTFVGANSNQLMGTMPSNQFQQLNLNGGYDFSSKTKLIANVSYGRGTSSGNTGYDAAMMLGPVSNFNGVVNQTHADIKLIDQSIKNLTLSAAYRYDERNDQSSSNIYNANSISGANPYYYPNTPLSYRKQLFDLSGVYKLTRDQNIGLTYLNQQVSRWCNQYATGTGGNPTTYYPPGTDCVTGNSTSSNGLNAFYKIRATEDLNFKVSYGADMRRATFDQNAVTAMSTANPNTAAFAVPMTPGQNANDYLGFQPFFEASRNQQTVKATANWQATDALSLGLGGRYAYDVYPDSTYGVQNGQAWSLNLDATYAYAEQGSLAAYVTQQNGTRKLTDYYYSTGTAATSVLYNGTWSNTLTDNATTLGVGWKHAGLLSNKLTLSADLTYSVANSAYNTVLNSSAKTTSGATLSCDASASTVSPSVSGACGGPPNIYNAMTALKIAAAYDIDKVQRVTLQYMFQHLDSNDYYFNGYQYGYTPTSVMPTNQTTPSYNVNVIMLMYTARM